MAPSDCPHLILQAMAGPLAAATASTVTNPMDVVRARVQVELSILRKGRLVKSRGCHCHLTLSPKEQMLVVNF